ncbi:helix-turn-helix transcriptional regulator [Spirosoma arcticum]
MTTHPVSAGAYLFFWPGQFLYIGPALDTHTHDHHALQVVVSLDKPFQIRTPQQDWQHHSAVLIASDQPHECLASQSTILFLNLDPETRLARFLKATYLEQSTFVSLPDAVTIPFVTALRQTLGGSVSCLSLARQLQELTDTLAGPVAVIPLDDRIVQAQTLLKESLGKPIPLAELSDSVCLSEGRLAHLFKEQVGIPIRRYVLWERLLLAIQQLTGGYNLTEAAHQAGFSDSAHFSRTFTRMFGLPPSLLTKNSQFVQARVCR